MDPAVRLTNENAPANETDGVPSRVAQRYGPVVRALHWCLPCIGVWSRWGVNAIVFRRAEAMTSPRASDVVPAAERTSRSFAIGHRSHAGHKLTRADRRVSLLHEQVTSSSSQEALDDLASAPTARASPPSAWRGMPFDVGDRVVYPYHGAAVIEKREEKDVFGENREYLVLRFAYGGLTLMVPADNTDEVGLREVIDDEEVEEVFAVLRKKEARMPTNWSRRYKNHVAKVKSGDVYQLAEVIRNLSIRDNDKGLSSVAEKGMLKRARQTLVSELTFAIGVSAEEAEEKLNEALA